LKSGRKREKSVEMKCLKTSHTSNTRELVKQTMQCI